MNKHTRRRGVNLCMALRQWITEKNILHKKRARKNPILLASVRENRINPKATGGADGGQKVHYDINNTGAGRTISQYIFFPPSELKIVLQF